MDWKTIRKNDLQQKQLKILHPIFFFVYDGFTKGIKNKHSVYRDKYYIKKFCECLEEDTLKIINFKSKQKNIKKKKTE